MFLFLIVLCHDTGFLNSAEVSLSWQQFQMFLFRLPEGLETSDLQVIQQVLQFFFVLKNGQRDRNVPEHAVGEQLSPSSFPLWLTTLMFFDSVCLLLHICLLLLAHVRQRRRS